MKKLLIVPDVHGRKFWRKIKEYEDTPVIFLGDYLDPFPDSDISKEDALAEFKEILDYAKGKENIKLLRGEHDAAYSIGRLICSDGIDRENYDDIRKMFWKKGNNFYMAWCGEVSGKKFLFTHAGLTRKWVETHPDVFAGPSFDFILNDWDWTNRCEKRLFDPYMKSLKDREPGSMVWATVKEHQYDTDKKTDIIQVFGHGNSNKPLFGTSDYEWRMLDVGRIFYIDEEAEIRDLETDENILVK